MSLLKRLEPTQNFTIQVQHYHEVIAEAQIVAIENLKHIDSKCTNYWTLFNAFYFSATGKFYARMIKWGVSSRWSFHPISAWGSIETTTIGKTHPSLLMSEDVPGKPQLLFRFLVTTTLGYGNVFPMTRDGRLFCIFYAMIGVPLYYFLMHMTTNYIIEKFINFYKVGYLWLCPFYVGHLTSYVIFSQYRYQVG